MIEIKLDDTRLRLEVTGHATAEECPEHSLICCAASTLAQGLAYSITKYEKEHEALQGMDYRGESGDLLIQIYPEEWARATMKKHLRTYGDGLEMLAICHPECIRMTWNGEEIKGGTEK